MSKIDRSKSNNNGNTWKNYILDNYMKILAFIGLTIMVLWPLTYGL